MEGYKVTSCNYCKSSTINIDTEICDGCNILRTRIKAAPNLARKMLNELPWPEGMPPIGAKLTVVDDPEFTPDQVLVVIDNVEDKVEVCAQDYGSCVCLEDVTPYKEA